MVNNITAERLAGKIDADEQFTLIDVRPEDSFEAWHVRDAENVSYDPDEGIERGPTERGGHTGRQPARRRDLREGSDVDAVRVRVGRARLRRHLGRHRRYGGVEQTLRGRPHRTSSDDLVVRQVQRRAKGCLGYVVGSKEVGEAVVVDATRQTDQFKVAAQDAGLSIARVLDTHVHADHISGSPTLADEVGVPYHLGDAARERGVEYEYDPLPDGDVIEVGDVGIEALHTPGHTSEMMNYLVDGELLLTGDTLFVDSVGRTELQFGEDDASRGAELLYDSLHETILNLPDDTTILPGHLTVTSDGRYENVLRVNPSKLGSGISATNSDFLGLDREAFVERLTEDTPEKPPNYETVIAINTGKETVEDESEATELELGPNNCAA